MTVRVSSQSPPEYFKQLVEAALVNQGTQAQELTAYYLVNLLTGFVAIDRAATGGSAFEDDPMAVRLLRALDGGGWRQRAELLRHVGDFSLFMAGFFGDSLRRRVVDVDYYALLGGCAYGSLSRCAQVERMSEVFAELAERFVDYVDVLAEVSEHSALTSSADLLRTYEKWLRTGSRRAGQRLAAQGIVPNRSIGQRFIQ